MTTSDRPWPEVAVLTFKNAAESVAEAVLALEGETLPLPKPRQKEADAIVRALQRAHAKIEDQIAELEALGDQ